jgi:hypothetical protein
VQPRLAAFDLDKIQQIALAIQKKVVKSQENLRATAERAGSPLRLRGSGEPHGHIHIRLKARWNPA